MNSIFSSKCNSAGKSARESFRGSCVGVLFCLFCFVAASRAANFTTSISQAAGQNWSGAIWVPQGGGAAVAPSAGNTYTMLSNGIAIFNLSANARIRNPIAAGVQTFPGDSLTVTTNTELRFKVTSGTSYPTMNFPGVGGSPGLIMDGGFFNIGDNGVVPITGVVQVASTLYVEAVPDHGTTLQPTRAINFFAQLTGSGTIVFLQSTTNTPHLIANNSNTFSGKWIVTSGRLLATGTNSLGTNTITIDPRAPVGLDPAYVVVTNGQAVLDVGYDLNSAGTLTLANGGKMQLHQNCAFSAVIIDGTPLSAGTHLYNSLLASFPTNFPPGGSGAITVQPYGVLPVLDGDGDGMADVWETEHGVSDPNDDADFDGLTNLQEFIAGTDPNDFDSDNDDLSDGDEVVTYLTNPIRPDTDGDGLGDGAEVNVYLSNPRLVDTDGDTLSDGAEVNTYHSSPILVDTDGDLFTDRMEVLFGGNPANAALFPDNLALVGTNLIGVKDSIATGADVPYSQQAVALRVNINDGNLATSVDTFNGATLTTCSYVGVAWPFAVTNPIAYIDLTMATFGDGGWFGVNNVGPGVGGFLTAAHLTEPIVQVSTNGGIDWIAIPFVSNYTNKLLGFRIGGGTGNPNPTTVTVTFTNTTAVSNINAIRIIGTEGGTASRGFIGVFEFAARTAVSDSDGDGMSDSWELVHGLTVGVNDAAGDPDADGLSNVNEFNRGTDPQLPDTDGDGLSDGAEVNTHLTNPLLADTDADGLSDGLEVNTYTSNPRVKDSDLDGFNDGVEVAAGTSPTNAASFPSNLALMSSASGILGTKAVVDGGDGTLVFNAGTPGNINDANLTTQVNSYAANGHPNSFVGLVWTNLITTPIVRLELTLATFFDGGWFGVPGIGPGSGGVLGTNYLREPIVQVSTNGGSNWVTVPHASDYLTALNGHALPAVDFGPPTSKTAYFLFINPVTNINGVRIIGSEGGTASGGFLGVWELAARNMVADSDGDGMNDQWEGFFGLTVGVDDSAGDPDGDGLSNVNEFRNNSNPNVPDTDGDGLNDGAEVNTYFTSPRKVDTDGDGLSDSAEVFTHLTNPTLVDTDGDAFADGLEVARSTNPNSASSHPSNYALVGAGILGTKASLDGTLGTLVFNAGAAASINDENLTTRVDSYAVNGQTNSFVGILWNRPFTNVTALQLSLAVFFDGGWFGVSGIGPGSGNFLSNSIHLLEPIVQVTSDGGVSWSAVSSTSDYLIALNGQPLPAVDFGPPTLATARFHLLAGQTNVNGIRIVGSEGGQASGGFLGVFDLSVELDGALPAPVLIVNTVMTGGQVQFQFNSLTGFTHVVQYKDNLTDTVWQTLTAITGDGALKTVTDTTSGAQRIYRVTTQ